MTAWRQAIELSIGAEDLARLASITRSRTEPASRGERARVLLAYREDPSFFAARLGVGGGGLWSKGGAGGSAAVGQGADDHRRGQGVAGLPGLPQGEGTGLSA